MVVELPERFLEWNYYPRRENAQLFLEGKHEQNMDWFFLDSTRHNPALCTAYQRPDGSLFVNAKIVGAGYVLKTERLPPAIEAFRQHLEHGDKLFNEAGSDKAGLDEAMRQYQREAMLLLMEHLYPLREKAHALVDFTKMSTMELAKSKPGSSKHTWNIVQTNRTACLLFYRPPNISFELHGYLDIHTQGLYYEFVSAVHDAFHYVPVESRKERPVYIFNVEEVYDNSPTPSAYGTRIA
ncbi:MAG TPA: hypothetical protein VJ249_12265 [Candidatus Bathyarchaeia archaeon]|nr:hypothetical protein [Candidatus Bathyarchaeia archaeon]